MAKLAANQHRLSLPPSTSELALSISRSDPSGLRPAQSRSAARTDVSDRRAPLDDRFNDGDGTDGDDVIVNATYSNGLGGSDTIRGSAGDDFLLGYNQDQFGEGVDGGDLIRGGIGADFITGAAGDDALTGDEGNDTLYGGGVGYSPEVTDGADTLKGGPGEDVARGNYGDDVLQGGAGDDNLGGQWGDDVLDGGVGYDRASFYLFYEAAGVKFNASAFRPNATVTIRDGMGGRDTLIGMDELIITGTAFNDTLAGSTVRDRLHGGDGANLIEAGRGDDTLSSYTGSSTLAGGDGNDLIQTYGYSSHTFSPSSGREVVDGGDGFDILSFQHRFASDSALIATLAADGSLTATVGELTIDGANIEAVSLSGAGGDDQLTGGASGDWLAGAFVDWRLEVDGDDTLIGGGGDDTLSGGWGDNRIDGGEGHDIYVWPQALWDDEEGLYLDASGFDVGGGTFTVSRPDGTDALSGIEGVGIYGANGSDTLIGSAGDDRLAGGIGADSIAGGDGDDVVVLPYMSPERAYRPDLDNTIVGGSGFDTLDVHSAITGVIVDLRQGRMGYAPSEGDKLIMLGVITGMEAVVGGDCGDLIKGAGAGEALFGADGDDTLAGGNGKDTLVGGTGADRLDGGAGKDLFVFAAIEESSRHAPDLITGYDIADTIDLHAIDADWTAAGDQAFTLVKSFDGHAGQLAVGVNHDVTSVSGDVDGDGVADFRIDLDGNHKGAIAFVF
jgi:Ca2+-binding RTX toxin-like protein